MAISFWRDSDSADLRNEIIRSPGMCLLFGSNAQTRRHARLGSRTPCGVINRTPHGFLFAIKEPDFASKMQPADGLVIFSPEYNHGYSGLLKHVLDSCREEYIHKAVGLVGVSAGPFGGTRVIQNLLPVMRELGLVTIFLGREFFEGARRILAGRWFARSVLHSSHRQISKRIDLDG